MRARAAPDSAPRGRRAAHQALGYLFESHLPVPLESIHAVYMKINEEGNTGGPHYIACGMDREKQNEHVQANDQLLHLGPKERPRCINAEIDPDSVNLLSGGFEPVPITRRRRHWLTSVAALIVLMTGLILAGVWRRAVMLETQRADIQQATTEIYKKVLGPRAANGSSGQSSALRLVAERRELQRTRRNNVEQYIEHDAAVALEQLLHHWPDGIHVQAQSIIVTDSAITVRAEVPSSDDAQRLADALGRLPEMSLDQPRMRSARRGPSGNMVQVTLRLEREKEPDA